MGKSGRPLVVKSAIWGLVAGVITVAACFVALGRFTGLSGFQAGWVTLAGLASVALTGFGTLSAMKSAVIIDRVDLTVTDLDMRSKNQAIALLARVFSMCSNELVRVFAEPDLFEPVVDSSLAALHIAICRCHGMDESRVRVSLIICDEPDLAGPGGPEGVPGVKMRSVPGNRVPRFDFTDDGMTDQLHAVMSRRHPYQNGWLWDDQYGGSSRSEYHVLAPEREVCSYIRVGIPGMGVLCVDSTDAAARLVVADRELALAFADVLAMPARVKLPTFAQLPAGSRELRNREEAVQQ